MEEAPSSRHALASPSEHGDEAVVMQEIKGGRQKGEGNAMAMVMCATCTVHPQFCLAHSLVEISSKTCTHC